MQQKDDTKVNREVTERTVKIIDSKYEKANLEEIYQPEHQLYAKEKVILLNLLKDIEDLFY